jgi:hypothetical protein
MEEPFISFSTESQDIRDDGMLYCGEYENYYSQTPP